MKIAKLKDISVSPSDPIKELMQKLTVTAEKILLILDQSGKLIGTITDGDIRRGIIDGRKFTDTADTVMQTSFIFLKDSESDIEGKAKKLMSKYALSHLPIVDIDGKPIDIISLVDLLEVGIKSQDKPLFETPVVIMAGGKGTRLEPFTNILPKPLIPLHDKPIIEHIMDRYYKQGFNNFYMVVNYKKEIIKGYFSENELPYKIQFIDESEYLGSAGGISLLKNRIKETFIITNCDTVLDGNCGDILSWHKGRGHLFTIIGSHREMVLPYGVLEVKDGAFDMINEKPKYDFLINTGTYIVEPEVFELIPEKQPLAMDVLITKVSKMEGNRVGVYPYWGEWFDIGQWDEYRKSLESFEGKMGF